MGGERRGRGPSMPDQKLFGRPRSVGSERPRKPEPGSGKTARVAKLRRAFLALEAEERAELLRMVAPATLESRLSPFADGMPRSDAALKAAARKPKAERKREGRRAPRRAVRRCAMIMAIQTAFSIECTIVDESRSGLRVRSERIHDAPSPCRVMEPYAASARICRVVWRDGDLAGLAYLD